MWVVLGCAGWCVWRMEWFRQVQVCGWVHALAGAGVSRWVSGGALLLLGFESEVVGLL